MAKFCSKCGSPLNENEHFCSNCGAPVGNADGSVKEEDAYADLKAQGPDWKQFIPKLSVGKPQVHINKGALVAFAVVLVIILIAAIFK